VVQRIARSRLEVFNLIMTMVASFCQRRGACTMRGVNNSEREEVV
jgi:hypothetical protein